jgi:hypothetical protein
MGTFKKATRQATFEKIAFIGPAGSGKTYSALLFARGLANGRKVAVLDSENGSSSNYSDLFEFDSLNIQPPYTVDKYISAIQAAVTEGYGIIVLDSISHEWAGDGGLLSQKEAADSRGGNQFTNWAPVTKAHERFKATLLNSPIDIICTLRSKTEYVIQQDTRGKSVPVKVGMAPIQRDGIEYEFSIVFDLAMNHEAVVSKDRTGVFDGQRFVTTTEHGATLRKWRDGGQALQVPKVAQGVDMPTPVLPTAPEPPLVAPTAKATDRITGGQRGHMMALLKDAGFKKRDEYIPFVNGVMKSHDIPTVGSTTELTVETAGFVIEALEELLTPLDPGDGDDDFLKA